MKKLFSILLIFAFCFPMARGQTVTFPEGRIASEDFVRAYVDSVLKAAPVVVKPPVVVVDPPPIGSLKPCEAGPEIRTITNITEQGLQILFHGKKVEGLDWQILAGGTTQRSGKIKPESNTLGIGYATLSAGTYTLRISGNTCIGASTREFVIEKFTGNINPPAPPVVPDRTLPGKYSYIGRTDTTYLDIVLTPTASGYLITDRANFALRDKYEFWYSINNTIVKSAGPLKDYAYPSQTGVLSITKHHYLNGLDNSARWAMGETSNPWYKPDASYVFSPRADVGGQSIILLTGYDAPAGTLAWLPIVPDWYVGSHTMSWPSLAPANTTQSGKMIGYNATISGITSRQRIARGETHISDQALPLMQQLGRVVGCRVLGINTTTGSREYYRSVADRIALQGAAAFETNEGEIWLPHASTQVRQIMERLTERYQQAGYPYFLNADYGGYGFLTKPIWEVDQSWKYRANPNELRQRDDYFRAFGDAINTINVKNYGSDPQDYGRDFMNRLSQFEIIKRAGYKAIGFTWNFLEIFQQGYGPGFAWQHNISGHNVLISSLAVMPYEEAVTDGFISMFYGDGLWIWDGQGMRNPDKTTLNLSYNAAKTTLNGLRVREDRNAFEGAFQPEPDAALDGFYVGAVDLISQCRATENGERKYVPFTIAGQTYQPQPDGSDALAAEKQKRGICQVRVKGNAATIFFADPFADLTWRDFSVSINGKTFTGKVFGKRAHIANVTL